MWMTSFFFFFLTNLNDSNPQLMNLTETFGNISREKTNNSKSALIFLNENERLKPILDTPFATTGEGFTYLGIKINSDVKQFSFFKL